MNTIGNIIRLTFFGESHGDALGITIDNLPAGIQLDFAMLDAELAKRRPKGIYSTSRIETDQYQVLSGFYEGKTTGGALTILIPNQNRQSGDYDDLTDKPRPSHADYPAFVKYHGYNDPRGGGMFSGRLTALFILAGAIAKQILNQKGIQVASHIQRVHHVTDARFDPNNITLDLAKQLQSLDFPVIDPLVEDAMKTTILNAKAELDSVGGIVETAVIGMPAGIGEPLFLSIESYLSQLLFGVPAVKGVEFGDGFGFAIEKGSEASDGYRFENGSVTTTANHNGGILGGISTGRPILLRSVVKPTASIGLPQQTVNLKTGENTTIEVKGRHDPAIVHRVVHVINAVVYFGILDLCLMSHSTDWIRP